LQPFEAYQGPYQEAEGASDSDKLEQELTEEEENDVVRDLIADGLSNEEARDVVGKDKVLAHGRSRRQQHHAEPRKAATNTHRARPMTVNPMQASRITGQGAQQAVHEVQNSGFQKRIASPDVSVPRPLTSPVLPAGRPPLPSPVSPKQRSFLPRVPQRKSLSDGLFGSPWTSLEPK
jgi:hypothetical protein